MSHRFPRIQRSSGSHARRPHGKTPVVSEPNCATSDGRLTDADTWRRFFLLLREHANAHATGDRNLSATWSSLSSDTLNPYEYRREPQLSTLPISPVDRDRRFVTEPLSNSERIVRCGSDALPHGAQTSVQVVQHAGMPAYRCSNPSCSATEPSSALERRTALPPTPVPRNRRSFPLRNRRCSRIMRPRHFSLKP